MSGPAGQWAAEGRVARGQPPPPPRPLGEGSHLEEVILVDHAAVGQRAEEPVGQCGLATVGHAAEAVDT